MRDFVRLLIRQPLSNYALNGLCCSHFIIHTKRGALIVSEIKLGQIALQVLLSDVVERPVNPTLKDREVTFDGVGVNVASHILSRAVIDGAVLIELAPDLFGNCAFVRHDIGCTVYMGLQDRAQCLGCYLDNMVRADATIALHQ